MSTDLQKSEQGVSVQQAEIIQSLVLNGDISKMDGNQKVKYYNEFCNSLGLNPLTQPFQIIIFQGKHKLYATKDCTDQLRKLYRVSITDLKHEQMGDIYKVTATAKDGTGRIDSATGVLSIKGLQGEALGNAIMKSESKAKRRVTLSICGLGILDESEIESLPKDVAHSPQNEPVGAVLEVIEMAGEAELNAIIDLLNNPALGETIFNGQSVKENMKNAIPKQFRENKLTKEKADKIISMLSAEIEQIENDLAQN